MITFLKPQNIKKTTSSGFTVIELLVAVSIILILTAIVVGRQVNFNSVALLESQTYELAFDIRRAQVQATAVRGEGATSEDFRYMYGMYIQPETQWRSGQNHQTVRYPIEFYNSNDSISVPGHSTSPRIENFGSPTIFDSRFRVVDTQKIGGLASSPGTSGLYIFFMRPEFDALFFDAEGFVSGDSDAYLIRIRPFNDDTLGRQVRVTRTGQITVEQIP